MNIEIISGRLAKNIIYLRKLRGLSQDQLAKLSSVPRTTISYIESGSGNPTLSNLVKISSTLQVSLEELMSDSHQDIKLYNLSELPTVKKGAGPVVNIKKILPDKISGLDFEQFNFEPGARFKGSPHVSNTKEYLYCLSGQVLITIEDETYLLKSGDLIAFKGDVKHSYENKSKTEEAVCYSLVSFVPLSV